MGDSELAEGECWYVFQCVLNGEARAELNLGRQGHRVFLPRVLRNVRHARKISVVRAPLFPGYGFVILNPARQPWRSINGTFGVSSLVMAGDRPKPLPGGVVESLMERMDRSVGAICFDGRPKPGDSVRVLAGPFADFIGKLERFDGKDRARVLLELMNSSVPVSTKISLLEPV